MKKAVVFIVVAMFALIQVHAQKTPTAKPPQKIKYKATTWWKNYKDSASISEEDAVDLLSQKIVLKDNKTSYTLVSYTFLYRRINYAEDVETKEKSQTSTISSKRFTATPLPDLWQQNVAEQLHSGEEFELFDVVGRDEKGKLFFATNLKIKIK